MRPLWMASGQFARPIAERLAAGSHRRPAQFHFRTSATAKSRDHRNGLQNRSPLFRVNEAGVISALLWISCRRTRFGLHQGFHRSTLAVLIGVVTKIIQVLMTCVFGLLRLHAITIRPAATTIMRTLSAPNCPVCQQLTRFIGARQADPSPCTLSNAAVADWLSPGKQSLRLRNWVGP